MKVIAETTTTSTSKVAGQDNQDKTRTDVQNILQDTTHQDNSCRVPVPSGGVIRDLSLVCPGLVLGGATGACGSASSLKAARISCIVSAASELPDTPLPARDTFFLRIPVADTVHDDLTPYFDLVADTISQIALSGGCTLVHCVAGVSRSAALCLAYLMREQHFTLKEAYKYLRSKRPQIRPNTGFFRQLIKYEEKLFGETSVKMVYNEAAEREIPDLYEPDYEEMVWFRRRYSIAGRH